MEVQQLGHVVLKVRERERANTQRIKVTLQPVDRFTGQDAQIGDIGQESGPDEPPP